MTNLTFIQVSLSHPELCKQFEEIMTSYILEINTHDANPRKIIMISLKKRFSSTQNAKI